MPESRLLPEGTTCTLFLCSAQATLSADPARTGRFCEEIRQSSGTAVVLGAHPDEEEEARRRGLRFVSESDLESSGMLEGANEVAISMAASWYSVPAMAGLLRHDDVNLGEVIQHPMTYFLLDGVRRALLLTRMFGRYSVGQISLFLPGEVKRVDPKISLQDLLSAWLAGGGRPAPVKRSYKEILRRAGNWLWGLVRLWQSLRPGPQGPDILLSADYKHVAPVVDELVKKKPYRLHYLREVYGVRQLPFFLRKKISFWAYKFEGRPSGHLVWESFSSTVAGSGVFKCGPIDLWPAIKEQFRARFFEDFVALAARLRYFKDFLRRRRIQFILVDEDVCPFNKSLILEANRQSIPSIVIQHGAPFWAVPIALWPVSCSKIAAWGAYSKELLLGWGVSAGKIEVTGVPRYDDFALPPAETGVRNRVAAELGLPTDKKIIVLATDPFHEPGRADFAGIYLTREELKKLVQMVLRAVDEIADCSLVIKLHPRDRYEDFTKGWVSEARPEAAVRVVREYSTNRLLRAADVLVTVCSTVAIEALLCGRPVITINIRGTRDLQPHAEKGVALGVKNQDQLTRGLKSVLSEGRARTELAQKAAEVLPSYIYANDGGSARRVAELVESLMENKASRDRQIPAGSQA